MVKTGFPFDAGPGANVTETQWAQMARLWLGSGVIAGVLSQLQVFADSTGMQYKVNSGQAWIEGYFFQSNAVETLPVAAADAANPRIDLAVVRLDTTANTIDLAMIQGTPAASPIAPVVTQTGAVWELALAEIRVGAAVVTIAAADVTDRRSYAAATTGRDGAVTAPGYGFVLDPDTGMYRIGANILGFAAGGVERLRVSAAGASLAGALTTGTVFGPDGTAGAPAYAFAADNNTGLYRPAVAEVAIATAGVQRVRVTAAGMTVAGTLSGADGAVAAPGLGFTSDPDTGVWHPAADTLALSTAGAERLRVLAGGAVAIGATAVTAGYLVEIAGSLHMTGQITARSSINSYNVAETAFVRLYYGSVGAQIESGGVLIMNYNSGGSGVNVYNGAANWGPVTASAFTVGSSRELKAAITDSAIGLAALANLKAKSFVFQGETKVRLGFIAEEVQPIVGEVAETRDMPQVDAAGKPLPPKQTLALDLMGMLAIAVRAIQEQQGQLVALTTRLTALEARVP